MKPRLSIGPSSPAKGQFSQYFPSNNKWKATESLQFNSSLKVDSESFLFDTLAFLFHQAAPLIPALSSTFTSTLNENMWFLPSSNPSIPIHCSQLQKQHQQPQQQQSPTNQSPISPLLIPMTALAKHHRPYALKILLKSNQSINLTQKSLQTSIHYSEEASRTHQPTYPDHQPFSVVTPVAVASATSTAANISGMLQTSPTPSNRILSRPLLNNFSALEQQRSRKKYSLYETSSHYKVNTHISSFNSPALPQSRSVQRMQKVPIPLPLREKKEALVVKESSKFHSYHISPSPNSNCSPYFQGIKQGPIIARCKEKIVQSSPRRSVQFSSSSSNISLLIDENLKRIASRIAESIIRMNILCNNNSDQVHKILMKFLSSQHQVLADIMHKSIVEMIETQSPTALEREISIQMYNYQQELKKLRRRRFGSDECEEFLSVPQLTHELEKFQEKLESICLHRAQSKVISEFEGVTTSKAHVLQAAFERQRQQKKIPQIIAEHAWLIGKDHPSDLPKRFDRFQRSHGDFELVSGDSITVAKLYEKKLKEAISFNKRTDDFS